MRSKLAVWVLVISSALSACGGGGGDSSATCRPTMANPDLCAAEGATNPTGVATLKLYLFDASGKPLTQVSPERGGVLVAAVNDSRGLAVPSVAVTFTSTDKTVVFAPTSGTALTDKDGLAAVGLPAGTQAGGFTASATATIGTAAPTGTTGYAVALPALTLSPLAIAPSTLSAGGTTSLSLTVLNGSAAYAPAQSVNFTSPCATAGKATISTPVVTVNGVASTSYTDKGCGGADTVTATTTLFGTAVSRTGTITVLPATAGQIAFVSALPQNISLKATGGAGRQESSTVTFKVLDRDGNPVSGQLVNFELTTEVGGLKRNPLFATTGADGSVSTVVASGTVNTPVRVKATLAGTLITTLSDQLVVSTGVPDQNSFSISTETYNVEGMNFDGCEAPIASKVRVSLADHFNNPAPDGTAVSFTAEGGTVDASCLTGLEKTTLTNGAVILQKGVPGQCTVRFCPASPRPADGRVTILAYALGEESFVDTNGNNLLEPAESYQDLGEPFRNDRAITDRNANGNWGTTGNAFSALNPDDIWATGNASPVAGETLIDTNFDGTWSRTGDGKYNGVLKPVQDFNNQTTHVRGALVQVLSTSDANITPLDVVPVQLDHCVNGTPFENRAKLLRLAIRDNNAVVFVGNRAVNLAPALLPLNGSDLSGNILPAGTLISLSITNGRILSPTSFIVPNTNDPSAARWVYPVVLSSDATQSPGLVCDNAFSSGLLNVRVVSPMGTLSSASFSTLD